MRLIAAAKQDHDDLAAPRKVHAIARTVVDPHLRNPAANRLHVAGIAEREAANAGRDAGARLMIS
jgi:hypothetical protein